MKGLKLTPQPLEQGTFQGMSGNVYWVLATPDGGYHAFMLAQVASKAAALDCGAAEYCFDGIKANTRTLWSALFKKKKRR